MIAAPEGLWEKRKSNPEFRDTRFDHTFKESKHGHQGVTAELDANLDIEYGHGHGSRELIFRYKPSKTVIEADLMFNLSTREQ